MLFNLSAILRTAHAAARSKIANNAAWRSYREAFAVSLKAAWRDAKMEAAMRAVQAEDAVAVALPAAIVRQAADLRILAGVQSFTFAGTARFRELMAEADDVAQAARCMMIPVPHFAGARA